MDGTGCVRRSAGSTVSPMRCRSCISLMRASAHVKCRTACNGPWVGDVASLPSGRGAIVPATGRLQDDAQRTDRLRGCMPETVVRLADRAAASRVAVHLSGVSIAYQLKDGGRYEAVAP